MPPGCERARVACWRSATVSRRLAGAFALGLRLCHRVGTARDRHATAFESRSLSMSDRPRPRRGSPSGAGRETSAGLTFLGQPPVDAALAALAVEQHAVFRLHE